MFKKLKRILIGKPLENEALADEKLRVFWGLPILSSDAISSVAYASQEILYVLVPVIGILAYTNLLYISAAIIGLLILLTFSYRQTIDNYPNGGGAYIVAKDNLGVIPGVIAGAALSVDYILTVAVSISSGVEQITSAFQSLRPYTVLICIVVVILLMIGNLRGIRESSKIFGLPAYAFMFAILSMIVVGFIKYKTGYTPTVQEIKGTTTDVSLLLLLKAFSSGCTALTGVEAVSNSIPNFKDPATKNAKKTLLLLSIIVFTLFGGTSILANLYHPVPGESAVIVQMAEMIFGRNFMFFFVTAITFIILVMAANTAYSGFPLLLSVMAKEGYVPRQLSMRGERLGYSNGIILLSSVSIILIIGFKAQVTKLIGLYAIGVFISFTLSQFGMFVKWMNHKEGSWRHKALINGFGALVTATAVVIIAITKFTHGAWIVVFLIPIMVFCMLKVKNHYVAIAEQLRISEEELEKVDIASDTYRNRVIVPVGGINKTSIRALRYAKTISKQVTAFNVSIDEESAQKIKDKYSHLHTDIPLIVRYSPYREIIEPLLEFIESEEYNYEKGDMITVILPQFEVKKWWHKALHNQTRVFIQNKLLKHKHIVVATMPLQLKHDEVILSKINPNEVQK